MKVKGDCDTAESVPIVTEPPVEESPICQPSEEVCDGIDNDCDNEIDENDVCQNLATSTEPSTTNTEPVEPLEDNIVPPETVNP